MDEIIKKAHELRAMIDNTPEMKEYLLNKELLENDKDVIALKQNIANLKAQGKFEQANNLKALYDANPLVNNYEVSKEALLQLLKTIENILK